MLSPDKIKVLIIEDDEDDYFIIQDYIREIDREKFIIEWCNDYTVALNQISNRSFDIYFIDYRLGYQTGLELLRDATALGCEEPFVLLTGKGNKEIDIEAMKSGATDYLIKSELNADKLERCIRYSLERNRYVKSLKHSEKKYKNLFEGSKDAVFIADADFHFVEVNDAATKLLECSCEEIKEQDLYHFLPVQFQRESIRSCIIKGENISEMEIDVETMRKEVKYCTLSVSLEKLLPEKQLLHLIIHDITGLRNAEKIKLQSEKIAASERLIRLLAHEVRNPLTNITLAAEQIKLQVSDDHILRCVSIVKNNGKRINQLITELLNFAKPGNLVLEKYTLQEIMEESLVTAEDRISLQKIELCKHFDSKPCYVRADKEKLKIAFSNLLINAIESMETNKGRLLVRVQNTTSKSIVSIEDNGNGIPEEYLARLSEPFFTTKRNGMGLGLAAAYSIFLSHKAHVEVKSTITQGTCFSITFGE